MYGILSASRVVDVAYSPFFFMSELGSHAGYFPRLFTTSSDLARLVEGTWVIEIVIRTQCNTNEL